MKRFAVPFLVLLGSLTACTTAEDPSTAAYWIAKLDTKQERSEALKQLGKIKDPAGLEHVLHWFDKSGPWQPNAAYALGGFGDMTVVPELIAAIDYTVGTGRDKKTANRNKTNLNIARALANLGAQNAADAIMRLTNVADDATRVGAIKSLGKLGNKQATDTLIQIAREERQPFVRKHAIQALGELGDAKATPTLIISLYTELPGTSFYYEARFALQQIGQPAVAGLIKTLKRENAEVDAIRLSGGVPIAEGAIEGKAAFVLGAMRAVEAEKPMIDALNRYYGAYKNRERVPVFASIPAAVAEIAYSLGNLGSNNAVSALLPLVADVDPNIRAAATEALTTLGATAAVKSLLAATKTGDLAAKRAAIIAASLLGDESTLGSLDSLATSAGEKDPLAQVVQAYRAPLNAAKECKNDTGCWRSKLSDTDAKIRQRAAYQLGWAQAQDALDDLLKAAEDNEASVRMAAVLSLGRIGGASVNKLQAIHDRWSKKIEYKDSTQELKRLIARLGEGA